MSRVYKSLDITGKKYGNFEVHSPYDGQAQEIILPYYINDCEKENEE